MRTFRFVIERTTVERAEVEVQADDLRSAAAIADVWPLEGSDWRRRRAACTKSFDEDTKRSVAHDVLSAREVR